ncbi:MAG TPA: IspD/TarI family cytidylyltransferase [Lachnospiraceae bacterium]|nr:IspD/TarI family cytidylyltransferase [Lachnospiraceae bacterium]HPF29480.1 IspD/TarI family cytidylyltransferase [Lachnospiraceae bacterium]
MNVAIILSGGTGTRVGGDLPKQYIPVAEKPIIAYCLETLEKHDKITGIWIVAQDCFYDLIRDYCGEKLMGFSKPGENRQCSIYNALKDLSSFLQAEDGVLIHDAARPLLSNGLVSACLSALERYDGVLPTLPMKDTIYYSEDGIQISSLMQRESLFAGQAPEAFRYGKYFATNEALWPDQIMQINGSAEPAILAGMEIGMIPGEERNFKITIKTDLERFRLIIKEDLQ